MNKKTKDEDEIIMACEHCFFFDPSKKEGEASGWCRRYPQIEIITNGADHWCGEFIKISDGARQL